MLFIASVAESILMLLLHQICNGSLCEALRQLGCFSESSTTIQSCSASHWKQLLKPSINSIASSCNSPKSFSHEQSQSPKASLSHTITNSSTTGSSTNLSANNNKKRVSSTDTDSGDAPSSLPSSPKHVDDHSIVNAFHAAFTTPLSEYKWVPKYLSVVVRQIQLRYFYKNSVTFDNVKRILRVAEWVR